jgi:hypothetical protein
MPRNFKRHDSFGSQTEQSARGDTGGREVHTRDGEGKNGIGARYRGHESNASHTVDPYTKNEGSGGVDLSARPVHGQPGRTYVSGANARGSAQRKFSKHNDGDY